MDEVGRQILGFLGLARVEDEACRADYFAAALDGRFDDAAAVGRARGDEGFFFQRRAARKDSHADRRSRARGGIGWGGRRDRHVAVLGEGDIDFAPGAGVAELLRAEGKGRGDVALKAERSLDREKRGEIRGDRLQPE